MKAIKTARKARMTNATLSSLMTVNHMSVSLEKFDPMPPVHHWMTMSKRRSIKYHPKPKLSSPPAKGTGTGIAGRDSSQSDSDADQAMPGPLFPMMMNELPGASAAKPDDDDDEDDDEDEDEDEDDDDDDVVYSSSGSEFEGFD